MKEPEYCLYTYLKNMFDEVFGGSVIGRIKVKLVNSPL